MNKKYIILTLLATTVMDLYQKLVSKHISIHWLNITTSIILLTITVWFWSKSGNLKKIIKSNKKIDLIEYLILFIFIVSSILFLG